MAPPSHWSTTGPAGRRPGWPGCSTGQADRRLSLRGPPRRTDRDPGAAVPRTGRGRGRPRAGVLLGDRPGEALEVGVAGAGAGGRSSGAAGRPRPPRAWPAGDDGGRHQPEQDLHGSRLRSRSRSRAAGTRAAPATRAARGARPRVRACRPTPRSRRSKSWCFQIGTVALSSSISAREASNASPRCAADGRDDDRGVADARASRPGAPRRPPRTSYRSATSSQTSRSRSSAVGWAEYSSPAHRACRRRGRAPPPRTG